MMTTQANITAAKAEFDALYIKPFATSADMDRMGLLGRRLYRLRLQLRTTA
jgi:hypothetical protein